MLLISLAPCVFRAKAWEPHMSSAGYVVVPGVRRTCPASPVQCSRRIIGSLPMYTPGKRLPLQPSTSSRAKSMLGNLPLARAGITRPGRRFAVRGQVAKVVGCRVVAVARGREKGAALKALGADVVIDPEAHPGQQLRALIKVPLMKRKRTRCVLLCVRSDVAMCPDHRVSGSLPRPLATWGL